MSRIFTADRVVYNAGFVLQLSAFTVAVKVRRTVNSGPALQTVYSEGDHTHFPQELLVLYWGSEFESSGNVMCRVWFQDNSALEPTMFIVDSGVPLTDLSEFHSIVLIQTSTSSRKLYIDGILKGTDTHNITGITGQSAAVLGAINDNGSFVQTITNTAICEHAKWDVALSINEMLAYVKGVTANRIRYPDLRVYIPLYGDSSPEPDFSSHARNGTVTGTTKANHAPVDMMTKLSKASFLDVVSGLTAVSRIFNVRHDISQEVGRTFNIRSDIAQFVNRIFNLRHDVLILTSRQFNLRHDVSQLVSRGFNLRHDLAGTVSRIFNARHDISQFVNRNFTVRYDILILVSRSFNIRHDILQLVSRTFNLRHDLSGTVNRVFNVRHDLAGSVNRTFNIRSDILNLVNRAFSLRHDISQSVSRTFNIRHDVSQFVNRVFNLRHDLAGAVSRIFNIRHDIEASPGTQILGITKVKILRSTTKVKLLRSKTKVKLLRMKSRVKI